ncbi:serine/threonine-protein phosphatase 6 regulatory ankyrin repeat subunit B-like, partial [Hyalella azteca]|uniref:Serine/threonine-protein phosphatase 6 regulatory ankyrin repeat subunit B-like n=1 Tax=Hyalella azteca TaxID=294128 RepID=A0A979FRP4_HYAAZ
MRRKENRSQDVEMGERTPLNRHPGDDPQPNSPSQETEITGETIQPQQLNSRIYTDDEIRENLLLHEAVIEHGKRAYGRLKHLLSFTTVQTVFKKDRSGKTVLQLTIEKEYDDCAKLIIDRSRAWLAQEDGNIETPLHHMIKYDRTKLLKKCLLDKSFPTSELINRKNKESLTAVHYAAENKKHEILAILLQNGGDPQALTNDSFTPLHFASKNGLEKCVALLLDAVRSMNDPQTSKHERTKAYVNSLTSTGHTALMFAAREGFRDICIQLKDTEVNIQCKD